MCPPPADQGLGGTRLTYACTSLSLDSTQAWDQPAGCRPSPEFSPSLLPTSAPWAERQKPPGRKRLELRCSEAKGPEGGCVVAPSSCSAKQLRLFAPYPQHTPCCSVSQALGSWVKPTGQEETLPRAEERKPPQSQQTAPRILDLQGGGGGGARCPPASQLSLL